MRDSASVGWHKQGRLSFTYMESHWNAYESNRYNVWENQSFKIKATCDHELMAIGLSCPVGEGKETPHNLSCGWVLTNWLGLEICDCHLELIIFVFASRIGILSISCEIALNWKPQNPLMISQYWLLQWFGVGRQQIITWTKVGSDLCGHRTSLDYNELNQLHELHMLSYHCHKRLFGPYKCFHVIIFGLLRSIALLFNRLIWLLLIFQFVTLANKTEFVDIVVHLSSIRLQTTTQKSAPRFCRFKIT